MKKCCFLGLGVMGYPIAGYLSKETELTVWNRTASKSEKFIQEHNAKLANSAKEACLNSDFVFLCLGNDDDVTEVFYSEEGIFNGIKAGAIVIDHTTTSAKLARKLHGECHDKKLDFLDCPVSGGQVGAQTGQLTVMAGGNEKAFNAANQLINLYSKSSVLIGKSGSGQLAKMVNQICIAGLVQALAEGINFGIKADLDMKKVIDVISKGAASSWQMENRAQTMIDDKFDFGFALNWMRKDLKYCLEEANKNKSYLPNTALVDQFYAKLQNKGCGNYDTSALIKNLIE